MKELLLNTIMSGWYIIWPLLVNVLVALLFILIGFLVARGCGWLVAAFFKLVKLDKGAKKVGFSGLLEKGEIRKTISELLGDLIYWVIIIITVIDAAQVFGLKIQPALSKIVVFTGVAFLAAIVLGAGLFLAALLSNIIKTLASNFGIEGAKTLSRLIYYIVVTFAFLAALAELGISTEVFVPQIGVIIGAFGLAAAIAFGLGCKDMAADFLHNLFKGR